MSNQKSKIVQSTKPSVKAKAWAYISIAGALVAIIYAGLSLQEEENKRYKRNYESVRKANTPKDTAKVEEEIPVFNNQQDPSR
ncbi:MAG: hypothetical protein AAFN10_15600 [Bacteroidota bacterium]